MGTSGVDICLSPAAARVFPLSIECKAVEALNVFTTFVNHYRKYENDGRLKLLIHTKNRSEKLVTLRLSDFIPIYEKTLPEPPSVSA